jgi:hypothetical protein
MEQKGPKVETRPPAVIDWIVRALIPPAVRESVVGDLWERYRSPRQYLSEAIRILPYIVSGQIRRSANLPLLATQAFLLFGCLGGFAAADGARTTRIDVPSWEGAALAAMVALIGLVLRDAYRKTDQWSAKRGILDIVAVVSCVLFSQALMAVAASPDWLLPPARALLFAISALPGLFVLRLVLGLDGDLRLSGVRAATDLSSDLLMQDYRAFADRVRARNHVFVAAGLFIVTAGAAFLWHFVNPPPVGYLFVAGHVLVVAYIILMGAARPMPQAAGLMAALTHYRGELDRQRRLFRFMWWWFLLPLFLGIAQQAIAPGVKSGETLRAVFGTAAVLLLVIFVTMLNRDRARKFQAKIAMLSESPER